MDNLIEMGLMVTVFSDYKTTARNHTGRNAIRPRDMLPDNYDIREKYWDNVSVRDHMNHVIGRL